MKEREITALEEALGYHFRHRAVIEQALTHSSQARELESQQGEIKVRVNDNEQLEFLGDAASPWSRAKNCSTAFLSSAKESFQNCALTW